jgi:hypothetical protein
MSLMLRMERLEAERDAEQEELAALWWAACLCEAGHHATPDHLPWRPSAELAWADARASGRAIAHVIRNDHDDVEEEW